MRRHHAINRRRMLHASSASLLAAGLWPGSIFAGDAGTSGAFHFAVINDLHFHDAKCGPWFDALVKHLKTRKERIEFCLLAGDLSEHGTTKQLMPVRDFFKEFGRPVHVVVGNHDHAAMNDRKAYEDAFPNSINYQFEHSGWQFIGLDSSEGTKSQSAVQPATLQWLDRTLPKLDKKKPTIMFTHFPFGPFVIYRVSNADAVLERFKEFNLQAIFSGHFHALTERKVGNVNVTTNRCCSHFRKNHDGSKEKGFFLCRAKDRRLERTFVEFTL